VDRSVRSRCALEETALVSTGSSAAGAPDNQRFRRWNTPSSGPEAGPGAVSVQRCAAGTIGAAVLGSNVATAAASACGRRSFAVLGSATSAGVGMR
jgi:hypothetical protein